MKGNIRKWGLLSLTAVTAVSLLQGCSSGKPAQESATGNQPPQGKVDTIRIWHDDKTDVFKNNIQKFNDTIGKEKGIHIDLRVMGGSDYADSLKVALAADQGPELYKFVGTVKDQFVNAGWMQPLEDFPGSKEFLKGYEGEIIPEYNTYKGKVYSVPYIVITTKMLYNKRLFEKAGITKVPETWDEVVEAARKITEKGEGKEFGFGTHLKDATTMGGKWSYAVMFAPSVGHMGYNFKTGQYQFKDFQPMLEKILLMKKEKSIFPGAEGMELDNLRAHFAEGRVGMMLGANWEVTNLKNSFPAKDDWGVAHVPVLDPSKKYKEYAQVGDYLVIGPAAKKNPEKTFIVYEYIHSLQFQRDILEAGNNFMAKKSVVEQSKIPDTKGWKEFSDLSTSYFTKTPPDGVLKLEGDSYQKTIAKIVAGGAPDIGKELEALDKRYNDALARSLKDGFDIAPFKDEKWDVSRK
ncbi:extracellular solute-binding protein [Paenibacillus filicis]|uniref:Extracellular solute-binding protein n=1 Tax=Paenibacillus filicis TaxID=669464 RepID=A0ABU9DHF1_9BACL